MRAGIVAASLATLAAFTSPPWPSPSYFREKDALIQQTYNALSARDCAIRGTNTLAAPAFYRSERDELMRYKAWITNNAAFFADTNKADGTSFDTWLATPYIVTNTFYGYVSTGLQDRIPTWSATGLVAALSLPTNYFTETPWRELNTVSNGWRHIPAIVSQLVWTVDRAGPWQSIESGGREVVGTYPQQLGSAGAFFWFWNTYEGEPWDGTCPIPVPGVSYGAGSSTGIAYQVSRTRTTNATPCGTFTAMDYYVRAGELTVPIYLPGGCLENYAAFANAPAGYQNGIWKRTLIASTASEYLTFGTNVFSTGPVVPAPGDSSYYAAAFDTGPGGSSFNIYNRNGWKASEQPYIVTRWVFAEP